MELTALSVSLKLHCGHVWKASWKWFASDGVVEIVAIKVAVAITMAITMAMATTMAIVIKMAITIAVVVLNYNGNYSCNCVQFLL